VNRFSCLALVTFVYSIVLVEFSHKDWSFLVACAAGCSACDKHGASRCDRGQCLSEFVYNNYTQTCFGEWKQC